ncbi:unnamed protein product [Absidia cylindrospora]
MTLRTTSVGRFCFRISPLYRCRYISSTVSRNRQPFRVLFFGTDDFAATHSRLSFKKKINRTVVLALWVLFVPLIVALAGNFKHSHQVQPKD